MIKNFKIYEGLYANVDKLRPTTKSLGGDELRLIMDEKNSDLLNREFTNCWIKITPSLGTYILHIVAWHPIIALKTLTFEYGYFDHTMKLSTLGTPSSYNLQLEDNTEITVYKEKDPLIIKNERDPYGEEDWEEYMDMKEAFEPWDDDDYTPSTPKPVLVKDRYLSFDDFLRFDLLGLAKLKELRRFFEDQIVVIEQKKGDDVKRTKGRVYKIRTVKRDNGKQVYLIDMMTKKGEKTVEVSNKYDKFKVKTPKKIKAPTDPYGEEDWELVAEPSVQDTKPPKASKKAGGKVKPLDKDEFMKFLKDKQESKPKKDKLKDKIEKQKKDREEILGKLKKMKRDQDLFG